MHVMWNIGEWKSPLFRIFAPFRPSGSHPAVLGSFWAFFCMVFFGCVFTLFFVICFQVSVSMSSSWFVCILFCAVAEFPFCNSIPIVLLLIYFWFTLWYIPLAHKTKTACDGSINLVIGGFAWFFRIHTTGCIFYLIPAQVLPVPSLQKHLHGIHRWQLLQRLPSAQPEQSPQIYSQNRSF